MLEMWKNLFIDLLSVTFLSHISYTPQHAIKQKAISNLVYKFKSTLLWGQSGRSKAQRTCAR